MADEMMTEGAGGAPADGAVAPTGSPAPAASGAGEGGAAPAGDGKASPPAADAGADGAAPPADKGAADGKAADSKGDGEATYEYSGLNIPDAWKAADDTIWQDAQKMLAETKVSPENAQKYVDFILERDKAIAKGVNDANADAWTKQADGWKAEVTKTYKPEELAGARKAVEQLFDKEGIQWMEALRLTDNPAFVKAMVKVSKAIAEDAFVPGNARPGNRDARSAFPNSNMNP